MIDIMKKIVFFSCVYDTNAALLLLYRYRLNEDEKTYNLKRLQSFIETSKMNVSFD